MFHMILRKIQIFRKRLCIILDLFIELDLHPFEEEDIEFKKKQLKRYVLRILGLIFLEKL